ncbi:pentapeptide repeat-containing protein [Kitasatospora sp. NPDC005856]|uniref:pentapeptide repeat-containing protein n=1 Tax=Kitasatospora sp. NPDC005856 TaxID=3154566 RepID=UPI0033F06D42
MLAVFACLTLILGPFTWRVAGASVHRLTGKEQADALNTVRQTVLAAFAGTAALGGLGFSIRTFYLSRRGQVTDRFSKAIGLLASDNLEERLGGIYALEHIMHESPRDHSTVLEVLCVFVRTRAPRDPAGEPNTTGTGRRRRRRPSAPPPEPPPDVDAVLTVLARRPNRPEPNRPDLRHTGLVGLSLRVHDFTARPRLTRAFLTFSDLRRADLRGLDLTQTILNRADLRNAMMHQTDLSRAGLMRADLRGAALSGAVLTECDLSGADLRDATGLSARQLSAAVLDSATKLPVGLQSDPWVEARLAVCLDWHARVAREGYVVPAPAPTPAPAAAAGNDGRQESST